MIRVASLMVILLCCTFAYGAGSIFDDDYVPPKLVPTPKPKPEPVQPQTPVKPDPAPGPAANNQPSPTRQRPPLVPPTDSVPAPAPADEDPLQTALAAATETLHKAEHVADEKLRAEPSYMAAEDRERAEAQKGNDTTAIKNLLQRLHDESFAKEPEYLEAKRYVTMLTRLIDASPRHRRGVVTPPPKTAEDLKQEIADAITQHTLVEGMSFVEACKSARKPFELVSKEGTHKTYNWILKGRTGSYQVNHKDFRGNNHPETVVTYGVIGHVQGVFEDDYLVSFSRIR